MAHTFSGTLTVTCKDGTFWASLIAIDRLFAYFAGKRIPHIFLVWTIHSLGSIQCSPKFCQNRVHKALYPSEHAMNRKQSVSIITTRMLKDSFMGGSINAAIMAYSRTINKETHVLARFPPTKRTLQRCETKLPSLNRWQPPTTASSKESRSRP